MNNKRSILTDSEIKVLASALRESQGKENEKQKIIDWLFRALLGILVWIGLGLKADVDILKQDVQKLGTERSYTDRQIQVMSDFMSEPRFTEKNYQSLTLPLVDQVNRNTLQIGKTNDEVDNVERRLREVEYNQDKLKSDNESY